MEIHSLQELDEALRSGMVLAIDNGTVTTKVDVTTIEKHAIESYAGSTLAGAAQSVQAALNGIFQSAYSLDGGTIVESGFNWDTCLTVGNYYLPTTGLADASVGTKPIAHPIGFLKVMKIRETANCTSQLFYVYDDLAAPYARNYTANNQTWSEWVKLPTRDELDNKLDLKSGKAIVRDTDLNTIQTPGTYFCSSASVAASLSNIPSQATAVGFRLDVARNGYNGDNYLTQTLVGVRYGLSSEYVRGMSVQGTWGEWQKTPAREEVDVLSSNLGDIRSLNVSLTADTDGIARLSKGVAAAINGVNSNIAAGATVVARIGINSTTMFGTLVKASNTAWFGMLTETATAKIVKLRWASDTPDDCTAWAEIE